MSLSDGITGIIDNLSEFAGSTAGKVTAGVAVGSALVGTGVLLASSTSKKSSKSTKKKGKRSKRSWQLDRKRISKQKWEVAYQKRKRKKARLKRKKSKRGRVKYTKNGQPYIILKSGKARFIKGKRR